MTEEVAVSIDEELSPVIIAPPVNIPPKPTKFGPSLKGNYPSEMRRQLWPLCCGASIISGFKNVATLSDEELLNQINHTIDKMIPDMQVYVHEVMKPSLTFLTLNNTQMASKKIMNAVSNAGFIKIGEATPRGRPQGFFVRDTSKSWKTENAE